MTTWAALDLASGWSGPTWCKTTINRGKFNVKASKVARWSSNTRGLFWRIVMPEEKGPDENKPKWTVTLGGGEWGTVKYGVVEYLRKHPRMRAVTAISGLTWMLGWLASTSGYHWHFLLLPTMSALFVTPTLLWFAVVSGPDFRLAFGEAKTPAPPAPPPPNAYAHKLRWTAAATNRDSDPHRAPGRAER